MPTSAQRGQTIKVSLDSTAAGSTFSIWVHSDPVVLTTAAASSAGTVRVTIPAGTELGTHRVVVQAADGTLYGWDDLRVVSAAAAASGDPLAYTGSEVWPGVAAGAGIILLGLAAVLARRRLKMRTT